MTRKIHIKTNRDKRFYDKGYNAGRQFRGDRPSKVTEGAINEARSIINLPDTNSIKWQGFTEAMNLIIASKR